MSLLRDPGKVAFKTQIQNPTFALDYHKARRICHQRAGPQNYFASRRTSGSKRWSNYFKVVGPQQKP